MIESRAKGVVADVSADERYRAFLDHTKCPFASLERLAIAPPVGDEGFFKIGGLRLYGKNSGGTTVPGPDGDLPSIDALISRTGETTTLPFNPSEVIDNLRFEKYVSAANAQISYIADSQSLSRRIYYALRPLFPVYVRRILQRIALQDWSKISFPAWPIDTTVEDLVNWLWTIALETTGASELPFIWYWPHGARAAAIMTHDVETGAGQDFCYRMLELEKEYNIKSAFELVPEVRYEVSDTVLDAIRKAGSEVCVHGLNHDGRLFSTREIFDSRVGPINSYAKKWGAKGFRSPVMYRNLNWYAAWEFSYDMSVPNVAHLDPQRGGCCTIFPYFVGDVLELPLTTIQDYPLFNVIRSDAMEMWTKQTQAIVARHGLASFIIHPDYIVEPHRQALYSELLKMLRSYGDSKDVWLALPGEVDTWWRERHQMRLTQTSGGWSVEGPGSDRASVAYVKRVNGKLNYVLPDGTVEAVEN